MKVYEKELRRIIREELIREGFLSNFGSDIKNISLGLLFLLAANGFVNPALALANKYNDPYAKNVAEQSADSVAKLRKEIGHKNFKRLEKSSRYNLSSKNLEKSIQDYENAINKFKKLKDHIDKNYENVNASTRDNFDRLEKNAKDQIREAGEKMSLAEREFNQEIQNLKTLYYKEIIDKENKDANYVQGI